MERSLIVNINIFIADQIEYFRSQNHFCLTPEQWNLITQGKYPPKLSVSRLCGVILGIAIYNNEWHKVPRIYGPPLHLMAFYQKNKQFIQATINSLIESSNSQTLQEVITKNTNGNIKYFDPIIDHIEKLKSEGLFFLTEEQWKLITQGMRQKPSYNVVCGVILGLVRYERRWREVPSTYGSPRQLNQFIIARKSFLEKAIPLLLKSSNCTNSRDFVTKNLKESFPDRSINEHYAIPTSLVTTAAEPKIIPFSKSKTLPKSLIGSSDGQNLKKLVKNNACELFKHNDPITLVIEDFKSRGLFCLTKEQWDRITEKMPSLARNPDIAEKYYLFICGIVLGLSRSLIKEKIDWSSLPKAYKAPDKPNEIMHFYHRNKHNGAIDKISATLRKESGCINLRALVEEHFKKYPPPAPTIKKQEAAITPRETTADQPVIVSWDDGNTFVCAASAMQKCIAKANRLAGHHGHAIFISGETGVGKEVVARDIHNQLSKTRKGRFITVNCATLTQEGLADSTLFGHGKGAYTGAEKCREGLFELANGGTLFLDEISELPLEAQAKLLRVIQESLVQRMGENTEKKVDVRIIAATNNDLAEAVRKGKFRKDLYYRLNAGNGIHVPPLRERPEDIPLLAQHFAKNCVKENNYPSAPEFTAEAMFLIQNRKWEGNVRELKTAIEAMTYDAYGNDNVRQGPYGVITRDVVEDNLGNYLSLEIDNNFPKAACENCGHRSNPGASDITSIPAAAAPYRPFISYEERNDGHKVHRHDGHEHHSGLNGKRKEEMRIG
jgi:hypothetical protein